MHNAYGYGSRSVILDHFMTIWAFPIFLEVPRGHSNHQKFTKFSPLSVHISQTHVRLHQCSEILNLLKVAYYENRKNDQNHQIVT